MSAKWGFPRPELTSCDSHNQQAKRARRPHAQMTAKAQLTPPPGPPPGARAHGNSVGKLIAGLLVAVLVVTAIGVVVFLPGRVAEHTAQNSAVSERARLDPAAQQSIYAIVREAGPTIESPSLSSPEINPSTTQAKTEPAPQAPRPPDEARAAAATQKVKTFAEAALRQALQRQVRLENAGVAVWGVEQVHTSYAQAQAVLAAADEDFAAGRYEQALAGYREAAGQFDTLEHSRPERLQASLAKGHAALAAGETSLAAGAFELALALEPGNAEATSHLERARRRPNVIAELERGRALQAQDKLREAQQAYESAVAIEADFAPAQQAAKKVAQQIRQRKFDAAMGEAIVALDAGRFDVARRALARARRIEPRSQQVVEVAQRLGAAVTLAKLSGLRKSAAQFEAQERWTEAVKAYDAALQLDDTASFAVNGQVRALNFAKLHSELERYLSNPQRLQSAAPLARAQKLLAAAERIGKAGPRLQQQRSKLAGLIDVAQQPVEVVLRSDGQTEITILRVQRLGAFNRRILQLRPGAYTALGTRAGYRDVRVRVEISPSTPSAPVDIRCVEAI